MTQIGILNVIAGNINGISGLPVNGNSLNSFFNNPIGIKVDNLGNIYITDCKNSVVEKLIPNSSGYELKVIAGDINGKSGLPTPGPALDSLLNIACGITVDSNGIIYVADTHNNIIEKLVPSKDGYELSIIAGNTDGISGLPINGPALESYFNLPSSIAVDSKGNIYISDYLNNVIEKLVPSKDGYELSVIAGDINGKAGLPTQGPALNSLLNGPSGIDIDKYGNIYIADCNNNVIEKLTPYEYGYYLTVIAGNINGKAGLPTPGPSLNSLLNSPSGVTIDLMDNIYISDTKNNLIEKLFPIESGYILSSVAGNIDGTAGLPINGNALNSYLNSPEDLTTDFLGNVYISDSKNNTIEKITFIPPIPCFSENTKILTNNGYKQIKDLQIGDMVKTLLNDYKPIVVIGKQKIEHFSCKERIKDQLYKYSVNTYSEIFEDLILTGGHSILVDKLTEEQQIKTKEYWNDLLKTDDKYRLLSVIDEKSDVYETSGIYTVYHIALDSDDCSINYGIYANGLLVETCSIDYLKKNSNMELYYSE